MTGLGLSLLAVLVAAALAAATYFVGGRPARELWAAAAGRAVAWGALALLLVNLSCPAPERLAQPLVLLDASASLDAAGAQGGRARLLADSLGEVRPFSGSRLAQALTAAVAVGRPVVVVTDGEILDAGAVPPGVRAAAAYRVLPRQPVDDLALTRLEGPRYAAQGDSLVIEAELRRFGAPSGANVGLELLAGDEVLARGNATVGVDGSGRGRLIVPSLSLTSGEHLLEVRVTPGNDAEPRTDRRLHWITVSATPGVVLVASPGGWDARFLYRALVDVAALPVEGYLMLAPGSWHRMRDLRLVGETVVRGAVREADLLVTLGEAAAGAERIPARARWEWLDGEPVAGDWYLAPGGGSPLDPAFAGIDPDSLPPANALTFVNPPAGSWTGLTAQLGRRGALRPAVYGVETATQRRLVVAAGGLWRWAFRGGLTEQAYRAWVATSVTWLLARPAAGTDALIRAVRAVVERDEPVTFEWVAAGPAAPVVLALEGPAGSRQDTLAFDGAGRARLELAPGRYEYRLESGSAGSLAVEEYSSEFLPATVTVQESEATTTPPGRRRGSRDLPWLFLLAIAGWCVEWGARRRAGMR